MVNCNLSHLKKGQKAIVSGYTSEDIPHKILEMGLLPGCELEVLGAAPFNGPICVFCGANKCQIALRKSEAALLLVEEMNA